MHLKCYHTLYDVKSTFKINNKFIIFMSPRSLAIYFQLNLFLKSHQKPPCDGDEVLLKSLARRSYPEGQHVDGLVVRLCTYRPY
jgi:hypothetical protein